MANLDVSNKRIMDTLRGRPTDRVPLVSPISWSPLKDIDKDNPGGWRADPLFKTIARLVQEHCDPRPSYNIVQPPAVWSKAPNGYQRFLEASPEHYEIMPSEVIGNRTRTRVVLHTPKGDLNYVYALEEGIETVWDLERPVKTPEDVERLLSVPYKFNPPAPSAFDAFRAFRKEKGPEFLTGGGVNSMVAMLCGIMEFDLLLEWVIAEPTLIKMLADTWLERVSEKMKYMLEQGVGPFWHFNGVERASPPMMGPKQWRTLVEPYDGEIMRLIKSYDKNSIIHVHCHGKVGTLLDSFMAMGVDSIDPVEPPNQGDIEIGDAKKRTGGRLTLWGNIEFVDLERATPDEVEDKVKHAIEDGGKDHKVLCPSATPHERATERFAKNAVRYIEAGVKYGKM
ncbi:MAG: uroporphyrinogen decarboxylase family protein [Planctomycetota bacterium]